MIFVVLLLLLASCTCERVYAPAYASKELQDAHAVMDSLQAKTDSLLCEMHKDMHAIMDKIPAAARADCD